MLMILFLATLLISPTSAVVLRDSSSEAAHAKQYVTVVIDGMSGILGKKQKCEILPDGRIWIKLPSGHDFKFDPKKSKQSSVETSPGYLSKKPGEIAGIEHCLFQKTSSASEYPVAIGAFEDGQRYDLTLLSREYKKVLQEGETIFPTLPLTHGTDRLIGGRTDGSGRPMSGSSGASFSRTHTTKFGPKHTFASTVDITSNLLEAPTNTSPAGSTIADLD